MYLHYFKIALKINVISKDHLCIPGLDHIISKVELKVHVFWMFDRGRL